MAENIKIIIDGQTIEVAPGTLILQAAQKLGIEIPTFCYDERLKPAGACRMCLVEVEKMPKLIASCVTPVAPNMIVHTDSEKVIEARKGIIELLLINHPLDCPTCDKGGECPLQDNTYSYGPGASKYAENKIRFISEEYNQSFDDIQLGPEIMLNRNRCIMCYRCIRTVRELAGEADLGVFKRGSFANINVFEEIEFKNEFSGNTVEYCPVGALTSKSFRYKIRDWLLKKTPSVCNLCSDGCNINIEWSGEKVYRYMSRRNDKVDSGWLCDRGRYSFDLLNSDDRIYRPLIKRSNNLEICSWEESNALIARHLSKAADSNRGSEIGVIGDASLTNEDAYSIGTFFRDIIKTEYIDFQHDTAIPLNEKMIKNIGLDGEIDELKKDDLFLFIGSDIAVEHPISSLKIRKAISGKKAEAVFIGPYDKRLGNFPVKNLKIGYGLEAKAVNQLISLSAGQIIDGPIDKEAAGSLIADMQNASNIHIISGKGFFDSHYKSELLKSLTELKEIFSAKLSILPEKCNYIGVAKFGLLGKDKHSVKEILDKVDNGEIKTLFLFGANPLEEFPDKKYIAETLKKLEFLVVADSLKSSVMSLASLVIPIAAHSERKGSFVNIEGRLQYFDKIGDDYISSNKAIWMILNEISALMDIDTLANSTNDLREELAKKFGIESKFKNGNIIYEKSSDSDFPAHQNGESDVKSEKYSYKIYSCHSALHLPWLTEKSPNLIRIDGKQVAVMHPEDAEKEGFEVNKIIRLGNDLSAINLPLRISKMVNRGEIMVVNSFSENNINRLMTKDRQNTFVAVSKG